jgi:HAD superfamily hydrolase (TIGR01484 family)
MQFQGLATDFDGTLTRTGAVSAVTAAALRRLRTAGAKLILVTGRELPELRQVFDELDIFDLVVVENGALLYFPVDDREELLSSPPPVRFLTALRDRGVTSLRVGRSIVASHASQSIVILDVIRELGLDLRVIFNKDSVMVLPVGVNKATGLAKALEYLNLPAKQVVAVGDAENDEPLLAYCGLGVAVVNALPSLKARADMVTRARDAEGVIELIEWMISEKPVPVTVAPRF